MRILAPLSVVLLLIITGCASFLKSELSEPIKLTDIERIHIGQDLSDTLLQLFGKPSKITNINQSTELWAYQGYRYGVLCERATFKIDKTHKVILSAVWLPDSVDDFSNPQSVLSHFKNTKFIIEKPKPLGNGHYYSNESHDSNLETGVSFAVSEQTNTVTGIVLGLPQHYRVPAAR